MPGIVASTRAFCVAIARTRSGSGRPESTVSATFGPTPETEIRRSKTYFSCVVAKPKSWSASSRTCMCTWTEAFSPAGGSAENVPRGIARPYPTPPTSRTSRSVRSSRTVPERRAITGLRFRAAHPRQELAVELDLQVGTLLLDESLQELVRLLAPEALAHGVLLLLESRLIERRHAVDAHDDRAPLGDGDGSLHLARLGREHGVQHGLRRAETGDRAAHRECVRGLDLQVELLRDPFEGCVRGHRLLERRERRFVLPLLLDVENDARLDFGERRQAGLLDLDELDDRLAARRRDRGGRGLTLLEGEQPLAELRVEPDARRGVGPREELGLVERHARPRELAQVVVGGLAHFRDLLAQARREALRFVARALVLEARANSGRDLEKRLDALARLLEDLDDVVSERALDRTDDLLLLRGEGGLFEFLHHAAAGKRSEVAARGFRAGIVRFGLRERREVRAALELPHRGLRLRLLGGVVRRLGLVEDVPRVHFLALAVGLRVRRVGGRDVRVRDLDRGTDLRGLDEEVFRLALLGLHVRRRVRLEVRLGLDVGRRRLRGRDEGQERQGDLLLDIPLLELGLNLPVRDDDGLGEEAVQLLEENLLALGLFEALGREAIRGQDAPVRRVAHENAVLHEQRLAALRVLDAEEVLRELVVRDLEVQALGLLAEEAPVDEGVEHLLGQVHGARKLGGVVLAVGLPVTILGERVFLLEFHRRDPDVAGRRRVGRLPSPSLGAHPPVRENEDHEDGDDRPEDPLEVLEVLAKCLEHCVLRRRARPWC